IGPPSRETPAQISPSEPERRYRHSSASPTPWTRAGRRASELNVRRGFNRLFVLAWVVWVLVGVWWAMNFTMTVRAELDLQIRQGEYAQANETNLAELRRRRKEAGFWNNVTALVTTRDGLRLVAALYLGLPVITYAVLFAAGWATGWVYWGFRGPDP